MNVHKLGSNLNLKYELSEGLRNREIEQKFLYNGKGAKYYYDNENGSDQKEYLFSKDDLLNFGDRYCFKKGIRNCIISLGCGNSSIESYIISKLSTKYEFKYIGIDSSNDMINYSIDNFKSLNIEKDYFHTDFSDRKFRDKLRDLISKKDNNIFSFFGNTIGNINHTNIIDILYNILKKGESIWIDVALRGDSSTEDNMKIFNKYKDFSKVEGVNNFFFYIFKNNNIPLNSGTILRTMKEEKSINALKIEFAFKFKNKVEINLDGNIVFLPREKVKFLQVCYYDQEGLIIFFKEHHFKLVDKQIKGMRGQFLFEKE